MNVPSLSFQPVQSRSVFSLDGYFVWCGTMVRDEKGTCHLFYSRWPIETTFNGWLTHSEVAHAVADDPLGPYRHVDVALPERGPAFWDGHNTHNPTVVRGGDKYYLYYTGDFGDRHITPHDLNWTHRNHQRIGVAVADSLDGPWTRSDRPLIDATPGFHDELMCANPSVVQRPQGDWLMIYKAVAKDRPLPFGGPVVHVVATSPSPTGPFTKHAHPIFVKDGVQFPAEDPFVWHDGHQYLAIVKDMGGFFTGAGRSLALMQSSDGFDWSPADPVLVSTTQYPQADGTIRKLEALERPQLWFDNGRPAVLFCAASERLANDQLRTWDVAIPLGVT